MENINLLEAIVSTMDTISIVGIENQDKFVGCASAIRSVIRSLRQEQAGKSTSGQSAGIPDSSNAQKDTVAEPAGISDSSDAQAASEWLM